MVSSISNTNSYYYNTAVSSTNKSLTEDQKTTLEEILSNYDSSSMTGDSMESLMDELKSAGIQPGKDVRDIMDAAGFKPPEKPEGKPPEEEASGVTKEIPDYLLDFIQKQETGSITQDDIDTLIQTLQNTGISSQGTLVDQKA